jgi:lipoate---protein ligase
MVHIALPDNSTERAGRQTAKRRLSFYLAMEEYVARELKQLDECFFMWQVAPTVIFGRNQLIQNEVNVDYCKVNRIDMQRRKSGGGCVYADMNNIMFSYINTGWNVSLTFGHYIEMVVAMLRSLGVDAIGSSRNDIMIDGRKVSGNAFYHIPGRNIVHGTMLYDTDMRNMVSAITPSDEKLVSKGVKSVRQHISLLKDYIGEKMDINQFKDYARKYMCDSEYVLNGYDIAAIEETQKEYHSEVYILGNNPSYNIQRKQRIEDVGEFDVRIELKNNIVKRVNLLGDFFLVGDLDALLSKFRNVAYDKMLLEKSLEDTDVSQTIMGLDVPKLVSLLAD